MRDLNHPLISILILLYPIGLRKQLPPIISKKDDHNLFERIKNRLALCLGVFSTSCVVDVMFTAWIDVTAPRPLQRSLSPSRILAYIYIYTYILPYSDALVSFVPFLVDRNVPYLKPNK